MSGADESTYRWSRAYGLRILGGMVIALAVLWVLSALLDFPGWSVVLLAGVGLLALGCLLRLVVFPPALLELSGDGYRLRNARGGGVASAGWPEVESVATDVGDDGSVMVVTLSEGRSSVVPLALLGRRAVVAERDFHGRLNTAFGYRPLGDS